MADKNFKKGQLVQVVGQELKVGKVAYVGKTDFAPGKWIGVILDKPLGKNNGTIQGKEYFKCEENHGMFVRPSHLRHYDDEENSTKGSVTSLSSTEGKIGTSMIPHPFDRKRKSFAPDSAKASPSSTSSSQRSSFVEVDSPKLNTSTTSISNSQMEESTTVMDKEVLLEKDKTIETLKNDVNDLNEKIETLMVKRREDKEKLKEMDKMRIQLQQLQEFKTKITESQADLQKQLAQAKKEAKEALEAKEQHADEMSDLTEAVEMATLDKEMAEEKAEALQGEVDQLKESLEEATLELELLKAELSEKGQDGVASNFQVKQLEQQNDRLKEALVKFRDLAASDKQEHARLQKEMEQLKSEISELSRTKEKMSSLIEDYEKQITELKEQVDIALGAEEMVEHLTARNLLLEEKVNELQEAVDDLEHLQDINDQLQEAARETELELREEVDMTRSKLTDSFRKIEILQEAIAEREQTIQKFREHTEQLKDANQDLRLQLAKETDKAASMPTENFDFKVKFAETRAFAKVVEMELRKLEVVQANMHVSYLCFFLSDNFLARGCDHDAIQLLLLVPRFIAKIDILASQVKAKYPLSDPITSELVLTTHGVEQYTFSCRLLHLLYSFQLLLHQYTSALNNCSVELFQKIGTLWSEVAAQERSLDFYIDLLRKDQLDETINLEMISKALQYFESLFNVHLSHEKTDYTALMADSVKMIAVAMDCVHASLESAVCLVKSPEDAEIVALLKEVLSSTEEVSQLAKRMKRRLPLENSKATLVLPEEVSKQLSQCREHTLVILNCCHFLRVSVQQHVMSSGEQSIDVHKLKELTHEATDKVYGKEDTGPYCLKNSYSTLVELLKPIYSAMQEGDYDSDISKEPKVVPPILLRAQMVKEEAKGMENLTSRLDGKEKDLIEIKKALAIKAEELSEMNIRKEMAEKKLEVANKDFDERQQKLQRQLDETKITLKKKEKEFEETLDHLQADIDSLESERGELKEKLKMFSKKAYIDRLSKSPAIAGLVSSSPCSPSPASVVQDSPLLLENIKNLKQSLNSIHEENILLKSKEIREKMGMLPDLRVPSKPKDSTGLMNMLDMPPKTTLSKLFKELDHVISQTDHLFYSPTVIDISQKNHVYQQRKKLEQILGLQRKFEKLQIQTHNLVASKTKGQVKTDFTTFPAPAKIAGSRTEELVGKVIISPFSAPNNKVQSKIPLVVNLNTLNEIHKKLF